MADLDRQEQQPISGVTTANASREDATSIGNLSNFSSPEKLSHPLSKTTATTGTGYVRAHFQQDIKLKRVDLIIILCCFITGITDATVFNAYSTFVSMQTGNTIFIALGASGQNSAPYGWALALVSMASFIIGAFFFARLYKYLGPHCRGTHVLSFSLQTLGLVLPAVLVATSLIEGSVPRVHSDRIVWNELAPVALLSFQAAGQIAASRALGIAEVPTVVITTLTNDLFGDPDLFRRDNVQRNRRIAGLLCTLVGAILGGWVGKATGSVAPALWICASLKAVIVVLFTCWNAKEEMKIRWHV